MHLLMTTFAFLMIFAIFSYAQFQKLSETSFSETLYTERFEVENENLATCFMERARELFHRKAPSTPQPASKNKNMGKRTGYLHIASLIQRGDVIQETEESKAAKLILKKLILSLYGDKTFFLDASMDDAKIDALIDLIFRNAKELANKNYLKDTKALANVGLNNEPFQEVLYKMLKGSVVGGQAKDPLFKTANNYKSLCSFVRFKKRIKNPTIMSIYLAPEELLLALFQDSKVVDKVIAKREEIFEKLDEDKDKKLNEEQLATDFITEFQPQIPAGIEKNLIDFKISRSNPALHSEEI